MIFTVRDCLKRYYSLGAAPAARQNRAVPLTSWARGATVSQKKLNLTYHGLNRFTLARRPHRGELPSGDQLYAQHRRLGLQVSDGATIVRTNP